MNKETTRIIDILNNIQKDETAHNTVSIKEIETLLSEKAIEILFEYDFDLGGDTEITNAFIKVTENGDLINLTYVDSYYGFDRFTAQYVKELKAS